MRDGATDDDPELSYEEMVAVLQRSTAMQSRIGSRAFTKRDVLRAASELGIDQAVASEVVENHLARRSSLEIAPRPFNTRLHLTVAPEILELTIPPVRPAARILAPLGFVSFWLVFMAFWTSGALLRGGGLSAALSIPAWAAGLTMAWRLLMPLVQGTRLRLHRDGGSFRVRPFGRTRKLQTSRLVPRIGDHMRYRIEGLGFETKPGTALLLEHGTETFALLDDYSDQEQRWVESELRVWLMTG